MLSFMHLCMDNTIIILGGEAIHNEKMHWILIYIFKMALKIFLLSLSDFPYIERKEAVK